MTEAGDRAKQSSSNETESDSGAAIPPPSSSIRAPRPSAVVEGVAFALIAALMAVQPLAAATYLRLFYEKSEQLVQPILPEGIPVPRSLIWNPRLYSLIGSLGSLTSAAVLGLYILFTCLFLYGLFRILNPTFRMTTGVDWDRSLLLKTYMHSEPITKAFLIAIAAFVPAFILWQLLGWALHESGFSLWLRLAISGAAFWVLFSRDGIAGDFESGSYEPPREPSARNSLLLRGALFGTIAWLMLRLAPSLSTDDLFNMYRSIGYVGPGQWQAIALITIGFALTFGFAGGGLAAALGIPGWSTQRRIRAALLPSVALLAAALFGRGWLPSYFAKRYDYAPQSRRPAESRLADLLHLREVRSDSAPPVSSQTAYLLNMNRAEPIRFSGRSVTGLPAGPGAARQIEAYLKARDYRTSLSYPAFTTLHDAALLQWSVPEALSLYLANLTGAPDMAYLSHLLNMLQGNAFSATPEFIAAIDRLTDDRLFDYDDRRAWVTVGDIYGRFGARDKAMVCYRRASMPASQVSLRAEERALNPTGRVTGRILYNGKPAPRTRVGLAAEQSLMHLQNMTDAATGFTSPFWLSWVGASATSDSKGRFTIDRLIPGRYAILVMLPGVETAGGKPLSITSDQSTFTLQPDSPPMDLKDIDLRPPHSP